MNASAYTKQVTILEGPDGAGKSTLAAKLAQDGALVVHLDRFPKVRNLARLHFEAMLPALMGYQKVVLDRGWVTERVYGQVYRNGDNRIDSACTRMLERVAARCAGEVVLCLPPLERCLETFRSRRDAEYLKHEDDLMRVWQAYDSAFSSGTLTSLPTSIYDYTDGKGLRSVAGQAWPAPLESRTAGCVLAPIVLVGEGFADHTDVDPLLQLPFASFGRASCARWLAGQLDQASISENQLLWVDAHDPMLAYVIAMHPRRGVIALGGVAARALHEARVEPGYVVEPPQHAKRFHYRAPYALPNLLKEILNEG